MLVAVVAVAATAVTITASRVTVQMLNLSQYYVLQAMHNCNDKKKRINNLIRL